MDTSLCQLARLWTCICRYFDHALYETFDKRLMPDIFASHSTEGTFTFLNACINKKFVLCKDVKVRHFTSMDGGSSGFRPEYARVPGWKHTLPSSPITIEQIIEDPQVKEVGFGYEECQNILMHDPTKFDEMAIPLNQKSSRSLWWSSICQQKTSVMTWLTTLSFQPMPKLSLIIPSIRPENWVSLVADMKYSCQSYDYEIIFVGPYLPPKRIGNGYSDSICKRFWLSVQSLTNRRVFSRRQVFGMVFRWLPYWT